MTGRCGWQFHKHRIHGAAIYGNIYHQYTPNVSIYTIHGSYGISYFRVRIPFWNYRGLMVKAVYIWDCLKLLARTVGQTQVEKTYLNMILVMFYIPMISPYLLVKSQSFAWICLRNLQKLKIPKVVDFPSWKRWKTSAQLIKVYKVLTPYMCWGKKKSICFMVIHLILGILKVIMGV